VNRFAVTLRVSLLAYHEDDARHLAAMYRDRVEGLGGSQTVVTVQSVEVDDATVKS